MENQHTKVGSSLNKAGKVRTGFSGSDVSTDVPKYISISIYTSWPQLACSQLPGWEKHILLMQLLTYYVKKRTLEL